MPLRHAEIRQTLNIYATLRPCGASRPVCRCLFWNRPYPPSATRQRLALNPSGGRGETAQARLQITPQR
eukprot:2625928-Rhodomonas_salina.2